MAYQREENQYRKRVWIKAIQQVRPLHDPPLMVRLGATFRLEKLRDPDNLTASLKWVLDALRQRQTGNMFWRLGVCDSMGYFVDDSPLHLELGEVRQEKASRSHQGLTVEIVPLV